MAESHVEAKKKSGKIYEAIWADWKSSEWGDSEIPDKIPVGEYKAKAKITKSGTELTSSDKKEFYVIFNTPSGLSDAEKNAYLYDDSGIKDEIGVWFYPFEGKGRDNKVNGGDFSMRYLLHPFNKKVFLKAIEKIEGRTSPKEATTELSKFVQQSFTYELAWQGVNSQGQHDVLTLINKPGAECSDMANILSAYLRSVGIAAHPTSVDANPRAMSAKRSTVWAYHTWTEAWLDNAWKATDPHDHLLGYTPICRRNFGTSRKWAYIKKVNDLVIFGTSSFKNSKLGTKTNYLQSGADIWFDFNPDAIQAFVSGVSVPEKPPLNHQESWVKDISFDYWNKHSYDPRKLSDPPQDIQVSTDKFAYNVGELVNINATITNSETTPLNLMLSISAMDIINPGKVPQEVTLYSSSETVFVPTNSNISVIKSFNLPQDLDTTDEFYVKASYGNQTDWAFFDVLPTFNITILLPSTMIEGEEYTFNLSINNTGSETLTGVNVALLVSPDMVELLDGESYYVGDLTVGEEASISWNVKVVGPSLGGITFKVESENGGIGYISNYVEVSTQPELDVEDEYVPFSGDFGEPFGIGFKIKNIGDLTATNVLAEITLPEDVTATETTWNIGDLAGGENVTLYTNITFTKPEDFIIEVFASDDAGHTAPGVIYVDVISNLSGNFNGMYSDYGLDTNGDGTYNYLVIEVGVNVASAGIGNIVGWLQDINGTKIAKAENSSYLSIGKHSIILKFGGFDIYKHGVSGPYDLKDLKLYNEGGMLIDSRNYAYTTTAYNYPDFQHLVALTGNYFDYGTDTEGNGLFDNLTIDVGVMLASEGHCVATARLIDNNGEEIIWASHTSWLEANKPQIVQLDFNGSAIYENGVNGPYYLKDVYIYHTGDPTQPDYVHDAYTTAAYDYTDFESVFGPKAIYVPKDYPTIQAAVNAASAGNTIIVRDGTYTENVNVNKSHLTIRSENGFANCIVQAANPDDHVFEVTADYVNISGFTVEGATGNPHGGIYLEADYCNITDNKCSNNYYGIELEYSNNNNISNNKCSENNMDGINLFYSRNRISNNNCSNNSGDGIYLGFSNNNGISNNNCSNNNWWGICPVYSNNNNISNNNCSNNYDGIHLFYGNNNSISNNKCLNNSDGGIWLSSSNNNLLYLNNFINNADNLDSYESTNEWNSKNEITYTYKGDTYTNYLGNYWDDYRGTDTDGDGIGDTSYTIDGDVDYYPLIVMRGPKDNQICPVP